MFSGLGTLEFGKELVLRHSLEAQIMMPTVLRIVVEIRGRMILTDYLSPYISP